MAQNDMTYYDTKTSLVYYGSRKTTIVNELTHRIKSESTRNHQSVIRRKNIYLTVDLVKNW